MKNLGCTVGLIALCAMKAGLVGLIWISVMGTLAVIGATRLLWVWHKRTPE